jgi:hypothetical protein
MYRHRLPIETEGWQHISKNDRVCVSNEIGDEYHYVILCSALKDERKKSLQHYCTQNPNACEILTNVWFM